MSIQFSDRVKEHKNFTKVDPFTWHVKKYSQRNMCSYFVSVLPTGIVMYGDYDGVIVQPHENSRKKIVEWMARADSLPYFAEKVRLANQHHQVKYFFPDVATKEFAEWLEGRYFWVEDKYGGKSSNEVCKMDVKNIKKMFFEGSRPRDFKSCPESSVELYRIIDDNINFDDQLSFINSLDKVTDETGIEFDMDDYEIGMDYSSQLRWQHECLLWWANNVKDLLKEGDYGIFDFPDGFTKIIEEEG